VEDNEKNRKLLNLILSSKGHVVFEAGDGREAVDTVLIKNRIL